MKLINNLKNNWTLALIVFSFFVCILWFHNGLPKATGESGLLFSILDKQLETTKYTWADTTIGETPFSFNGALPLFVLFKIASTFLSPAAVQALFFGTIIFLGAYGSALITKEIFPQIKSKFLLFVGISYIFNPYSIVFIWNRFLYNYTFAYGLIPFLLYLWISFVRRKQKGTIVLFLFMSIIGAFAFTGVAYLVTFASGAFIATIGLLFTEKNKTKVFSLSFLLGVTFIFSQLFWFVPFYAGNRLGVGQSVSFFSEEGNLHTTIQLSEYYGGLVNKLTQIRADMPVLAYEGIPWAQWYSTTIVYYASYIALIMTLGSVVILFASKIKYRFLGIILLLGLLLLVNGTSQPLGPIYLLIYKLHPALEVLRNPYEKMGLLLYLVVFVFWGAGLWLAYSKMSKLFGNILFAISVVWWGINAVPVFNGVVFTYKYEVSNNPSVGFSVKVPDYYKDAKNFLSKKDYQSRILALPITGEGITHTWGYGYDGVESYNGFFNKATISLDTTTGQLPQIAKIIRETKPSSLFPVLKNLNVSDVIVRHDLVPPVNTATPQSISKDIHNLLPGGPDKVFGNNALEVYSLPDVYQSPRIFLSENYLYQNKVKFDPFNLPDGATSVFSQKMEAEDIVDNIYPDAVFSENIDKNTSSYSDNQLLLPPHVSVQRDSRLYPAILLKEKLWKLTHGYEMTAVYSTLSFKRLAEIESLLNKGKTEELVKAIKDYKTASEPLILEAKSKIQISGGNRAFWDLVFRSEEKALLKYISEAGVQERHLLERLHEDILNELYSANVFPSFENKLDAKENYFLNRTVFTVPTSGRYNINLLTGIDGVKVGDEVQVDDKIIKIKKGGTLINKMEIPVDLAAGKHEIRALISNEFQQLAADEISLGSLEATTLQSKTWEINTPSGSGDVVLNFEYKILKGEGPKLDIFQENNLVKPLLSQSYPSDAYDFDWKQKTVVVPFLYDMNKIKFLFSSVPSNDCEKNNPLDTKCSLLAFKQVYDRHSNFVLKNVNVLIKPNINVFLSTRKQVASNNDQNAKIEWQEVNPALYKIRIDNINSPKLLVFLSQFHPGWAIYNYKDFEISGGSLKNWEKYNSVEGTGKISFIDQFAITVKSFFKKPVYEESSHIIADGYANGWFVDKPGTYVLVFRPQQLLYLSWTLTIVFSLTFGFYLYKFFNKNEKNKNN